MAALAHDSKENDTPDTECRSVHASTADSVPPDKTSDQMSRSLKSGRVSGGPNLGQCALALIRSPWD